MTKRPKGRFFFGRAGDRGRARTCTPQLRRVMLYPVELRGQSRAQGHASRSACWKLDPRAFQHAPDHPRVRHRNRCFTLDALGPRPRLRTELARAGEMLAIPTEQTPGYLDLGTRDHARPSPVWAGD